MSEMV